MISISDETLAAIEEDCGFRLDNRERRELGQRLGMNAFRLALRDEMPAPKMARKQLGELRENTRRQIDLMAALMPQHLAEDVFDGCFRVLRWVDTELARVQARGGRRPEWALDVFVHDMAVFYKECSGKEASANWSDIEKAYVGRFVDFLRVVNGCLPAQLRYTHDIGERAKTSLKRKIGCDSKRCPVCASSEMPDETL